jgi:hypothetical protein
MKVLLYVVSAVPSVGSKRDSSFDVRCILSLSQCHLEVRVTPLDDVSVETNTQQQTATLIYHYFLGVILYDLGATKLNHAIPKGFDGIGLHSTAIYFILGSFIKSRKARLLASSCLSVRRHETTRLSIDGFKRRFKFGYFSKICHEYWSSIKI